MLQERPLYERCKNLAIIFESHADLLASADEFDKISKFSSQLCDGLSRRLTNKTLKPPLTTIIRLNDQNFLGVHLSAIHKNNPYLFYYNAATNIVDKQIPWKIFRTLSQPYIQYSIEDKIFNIDNPQYHGIVSEQMQKYIDEMLR